MSADEYTASESKVIGMRLEATKNEDDYNVWITDDEWQNALEDAFSKAEIPRSKGSLVTKTIDDRDYYYLQWREGDSVKSQYVAPVSPAQ